MFLKSNSVLFLFALLVVFSSCSVTTSLKTSQSKLNRQAEANANSSKLVNKPLVADLTISTERKQLVYKTTNVDMANSVIMVAGQNGKKKSSSLFTASESMKEEALNRAQFQFMMDFKCDYLIDPIYKVETESQSGSKVISITVELSAYPANYKSFSQPDSLPKSIVGEDKMKTGPLSRTFLGQKIEMPSLISKGSGSKKLSTNQSRKTNEKPRSTSGFILGSGNSVFYADPIGFLQVDSIYFNDYDGQETDPSLGLFVGLQYNAALSKRFGVMTGFNLRVVSWESERNLSGYPFISGTRKTEGNLFSLEIPIAFRINLLKRFGFYAGTAINYIGANRYKVEDNGTIYDFNFNQVPYNAEDSGSLEIEKKIQTGRILGLEYVSNNGFFVGYRTQSMGGDLQWDGSFFYLGKNF